MRIFKAPGKKQTPYLHGKGGIGKFFNKIFNAGLEPLNWAEKLKKKLKFTVTPQGKVASKTSLSGGRRRRFRVRTGYKGLRVGTHKKRFGKKTKGKSWWVRAHRRKTHMRGGGDY